MGPGRILVGIGMGGRGMKNEERPVFRRAICMRCGNRDVETVKVGFPVKVSGGEVVRWRQARTCRRCNNYWAVWADGRIETYGEDGHWNPIPEGCLMVLEREEA